MTSLFKLSILSAMVTALSFMGCADNLMSEKSLAGESDSGTSQRSPKLRHSHLLDQAKRSGVVVAKRRSTTLTEEIAPAEEQPDSDDSYRESEPDDDVVISINPEATYVSLIIRLNDSVLEADKVLRRYKLLRRYEYEGTFNGLAAEIDQELLKEVLAQMEGDPDIEWVEPDIFINLEDQDQVAKGYEQKLPWGIERIGATQSSAQSGDGQGAVEGVNFFIIDSGVHLMDINTDLYGLDNFSASWSSLDWYGHGMHNAATAVARDDEYGIVGVAPGARTWSMKVLDENGETEMSSAIAALEEVLKIQKEYEGTPAVVNISFGADVGTTEYTALDDAVESLVSQGIVVVVSAGNEGIDASTVTPAHASGAITVGAYDVYNRFAPFSNYGRSVDILAPGVDILSLGTLDQSMSLFTGVTMTGTSMAAPHVAGAALLYLSTNRKASPTRVRSALLRASKDVITYAPSNTTTKTVWVGGF